MANLKKALIVGLLAAVAASSLAGFFALGGSPARLLVDAGLAVVVVVLVTTLLSPTERRVDALVEALRALSRGDRRARVDADTFAGLSEVARALNEVAASLTENDDPNLGPIKAVKRDARKELPRAVGEPQPIKRSLVNGEEADPNVGSIRKLKRDGDDLPARVSIHDAVAAVRQRSESPKGASDVPAVSRAERDGAVRDEQAAPSNDTMVDDQRLLSSAVKSDGGGVLLSGTWSTEQPSVPLRADLEALFHDFVRQKKEHDENVADLELDAFVETIRSECDRLLKEHSCRGVKFEITTQEGEVSLRPRLLR